MSALTSPAEAPSAFKKKLACLALISAPPARFPFSPAEVAAFRGDAGDVVVGFDHPNYGHMALMPPAVRRVLAGRLSQICEGGRADCQ